jgi:molybdate-binding protein
MNTDIFRPFNEGNFMKVTVAEVELGLASREGLSLSDLPRIKFLNRPHGASARALVEELMLREGIVTGQVHRYCDYAKTDEGVITAIVNRTADAGICRSESAARAGLAWKPIGSESFEMVFPQARSEDPPLSGAFRALRSTEYQRNMVSLGYSTRRCGHITPCLADTAGKDEIMIKDRLS